MIVIIMIITAIIMVIIITKNNNKTINICVQPQSEFVFKYRFPYTFSTFYGEKLLYYNT